MDSPLTLGYDQKVRDLRSQPPATGEPPAAQPAVGRGGAAAGGATAATATATAATAATAPSWLASVDVRRWGIRPKLIAVVVIPTAAALLLGGLRMKSALETSASYTRLGSLATVVPQVDGLVDALQNERDLTAGVLAAPSPAGLSVLDSARRRVNDAVTALRAGMAGVDTSHDRVLLQRMRATLANLDDLAVTRRATELNAAPASTVSASYTSTIGGLLGIVDELAVQSRSGDLTRRAAALQALANAKEAASRQRELLYGALQTGRFQGGALTDFAAAQARRQDGIAEYLAGATTAGQAQYRSVVAGPGVNAAGAAVNRALATGSAQDLGLSPAQWYAAASDQLARLGRVQSSQVAGLSNRIHSLSQSAREGALDSAWIICLILGFALLATLLVARSILRPLQKLRSGALSVAYRELPDSVRELQDGNVAISAVNVEPILVGRDDEIGQVARAFDAVHSEALHLAGEQALMRGNVSKMFVNLSRRSQSLVERQLRLIDELEAGEQDADQLSSLFQLDHLATRMRRNDESLLVLAGEDGGRRHSEPVPMVDVLRAATAEVEQYSRVSVDAQAGHWLVGAAANDVVHLLAELIENATTFSAPNTQVWLRSRGLGPAGELVIDLEDQGIGMSPADLATANERLATASTLDVSMSRLMGLFVVGRLAQRHRIQVQLHAAPAGGITALVRLPAELITVPVFAPVAANGAASPPPDIARSPVKDDSPIFFALQSEWFTRRVPDSYPPTNGSKEVPLEPMWESPGDEGWRTAAAVSASTTQLEQVNEDGLPVRVPGRNLVPGSAQGSADLAASGPPVLRRDPTQQRALSSFQQGVQRARATGEAATRQDPGPGGPDDQEV